MKTYDIVMVSDFRYPGGTSASIAEEIRAQARAGYRTGLVQLPAAHLGRVGGFNRRVLDTVRAGMADLLHPGRAYGAEIVVVRQPRVLETPPIDLPELSTDRVLMVANQSPRDLAKRKAYYDVGEVRDRLDQLFGVPVTWTPIGPLVRQSLVDEGVELDLAVVDWHNIIDVDDWRVDRASFVSDRPVLGRHGRPSPKKWPATAAEILAAYPEDPRFRVRILGGGEEAVKILGRQPSNWELLPFNSQDPRTFLSRIDYFVYYHHPQLVEAFGRATLEALASGCVAILPDHFRRLFGEACLYADPADVTGRIAELHGAPETFREQSERGTAYVRDEYGYDSHVRRIGELIGGPSGTAVPTAAPRRNTRRLMFVTSNGAGLGHLTRLMSIARRLPAGWDAVFATQSQAVPLVRREGFWTEYIPSRGYLQADASDWNDFLERRLNSLLQTYAPEALIFDGTVPYGGLQLALRAHPDLPAVWVRRAMWQEGGGERWLKRAADFSTIIEPGEFATAWDAGATVSVRDASVLVDPIVFFDDTDLVDRDAARQTVGLPTEGLAALVLLGAGNINDVASPTRMLIEALADRGVHPVVARSPIAIDPVDPEPPALPTDRYPITRYVRAFDFVIAAAGYNTYHELLAFHTPSVFVPNLETALDDQLGRARYAEHVGAGLCLEQPTRTGIAVVVERMLDPALRESMTSRARELWPGNGAVAAADAVVETALRGARRSA